MAGLFGVVALAAGRPLERSGCEPLLREMAGRLSHGEQERAELWFAPEAGAALGRLVAPRREPIPWPAEGSFPAWLLDGILHPGDTPATAQPEERLRGLGGFFSAAAVEREPRRVVLAVDRHASHPLAFAVHGEFLYFAPEAKALLAVPGLPRQPNPSALGLFFGGGYVLADRTLLAGVERLGGGEMLVIERSGPSRRAYWEYRLTDAGDGTPAPELERELAELVRATVARNFGSAERSIARRLAAELGSDHAWLPREVSHFARDFTRLAWILEGLSDTPASHPYELEMVRRMVERGFERVLRGDECFGWGHPVPSIEAALSELGLRRPRGLGRLEQLLRPGACAAWDEAGAAELERLARSVHGQSPDTARDELYFRHRLQGMLNSIAWAKHVVTDHRNPLLDEAILDFNTRVAAPLRNEKQLFRRACARAFPRVWSLPFAKSQNLVRWGLQLSTPTPARRFLAAELADEDSPVWEHFRRDAVRAWFDELRPPASGARRSAMARLRSALARIPALERRLRTEFQRRVLRPEDFFVRFLAVKAFFDLFVAGDGGRRAYEARLERALALDAGHEGTAR
jgi:asparagine synthetase B (glutamine-hydrolysing)